MNISLTNARATLGELVNHASFNCEPIRITCNNVPIAAIVSIKDVEELERLREEVEDLEDAIDVLKMECDGEDDSSNWITFDELMAKLHPYEVSSKHCLSLLLGPPTNQ